MINNDTAKSTYTVTAGVMEYPIGFQYTTNPDGTPNLYVCIGDLYGDNTELEYAAGYELSADGESVVVLAAVEVGATLNIALNERFVQDSDYTIGRIDPEQIERDFDKAALRDIELVDYINDTRSRMDGKQDQIPDLDDIRAGAAAGATAVQPSDLATVATTGSYNDLTNKPKYGASLVLSINSSTYVLTATLKDQNGDALGTAQTIDLPLESVVVSGAYDSATKEVVLTLQSGSVVRFSVADLVSGLQTEITSLNMLSADLVDDTNSTHKFVTASEKTAISTAVQPSDLATVARSGSYNDLSDRPTIQDIKWATPRITTYQQIKDWFDNKKTVLINATPDIYYLSKIDASAAHFTRTTGTVIEELWVYTNDVWASAQWTTQLFTNLVTSVSSESTDSQYPSAKLFYDTCGDIESLINAL